MTMLLAVVAVAGGDFDHTHATLDALLKRHVSRGVVRYGALSKDPALDVYVNALAATTAGELRGFTEQQRKAFWINAYNALTLKLIVDHQPTTSIREIDAPWDRPKFDAGGRKVSLNQIEHEILRKQHPDARLHAVLVCAAKSCPILQTAAYVAPRLDAQLRRAARVWARDPSKNRFDADAGVLWVSKILDWYGDDFIADYARGQDKAAGARAFYRRFADKEVPPATRVEFLEYDWSLNGSF